MLVFGSGMSTAASARAAAAEATAQAQAAFVGTKATPKLAIVFASITYDEANTAPKAIRELVGDIPIVGGSAGSCVLGPADVATRGISVVLIGGDDIQVVSRAAEIGSPELVSVVPAAQEIARAADEAAKNGLLHYLCLVFAPGIFVDGEALVAAVRKGAGARAQLAGGLTGDDLTMDRPKVWANDELRSDHVVLAGIFTKKNVGIAARHGWRAVGPMRTVTRADGPLLIELDGRPALDVWLEDAKRAGATLPSATATNKELALYLANHYELGISDTPSGNYQTKGDSKKTEDEGELVARAPWAIEEDRTIKLSASIGEGRRVRVIHAARKDLLRASTDAASDAVMRAGNTVAGALVLACSGRLAVLGDEFSEEASLIRRRVSAPIGGACVFGEIAKNGRDFDAFFNTTAVVVAFST